MAKSLRQTTMKVKIDVDSKQLKTANEQIDDTVRSAEQLEKSSKKSSKAVEQTGSSVAKSSEALKKNAKSTENVSKENDSLSRSAKKSGDSLKDQAKSGKQAKDSMDNLASSGKNLKEALATIGAAAIAKQMYDLGKAAIQVGMDFDKGMSAVKATAGATASEFQAMREQAILLGASTTKSASEVSAGQLELTKSGMSAKQAMEAIPGAISASAASGEDMALTVSVMTSALNGFQLKASESAHVADVLAMAANKSKADINDMGYAFKYAATPAKALGMSLEEASSSVMIMTNAGLAGEQAGTSLRSALISLTKPSEDASKKMDQLGVAITNSKGDMRPFSDIMNGLRDKTEGMGNAQKMAALSTIFGTEAASGMLAIIDSAPGTMEKFTKSLKNSDGASKKTADTMTDNLSGSVEGLKGAFESAAISVSDVLTPTVQKGTEALSDLIGRFNDLSPSAKSMVVWGSIIVGGVIPASIALYKVHKAVKSIREVMGGAKSFFSNYRREMQLTGAQAVATAGEIQIMNKAMGGTTVTGGTAVKGGNSTGKKSVILDQYGNPLQSSSTKTITIPKTTAASTTVVSTASKNTKSGFFTNLFGGNKYNSLGKIDTKTGMLKNTFNGKGTLGLLAKGGKRIPILGAALGIGALALGGKENLGSNAGSLGGGMAGAAAGAAIGSVIPGVGTAIGGVVGGIAGSVFGEKFGETAQKSLKKHSPKVLSENLDFGKGVSKGAASAVKEYQKLNSKATEQLNLLQWSGEKISKSTAKSLKATYGDMADSIQKSMKMKFGQSEKTFSDFMKNSGLSEKEQNAITKSVENNHKKQKATVEKYQNQINKIIDKAAKERRSLTDQERRQINNIQNKMNNTAVKTLSKSAKEQRTIMTTLKNESSNISAKQAADVVKQSKKARDGAVKEANKKYKDVVAAADQEYYENGSITKKQHDDIIAKAKSQRDGAVKQAEDMHINVVNQAKKQAKGHVEQVDWETGKVLGKWDTFKISLARVVNSVTGGINKVLDFFNIPQIPEWKPSGYSAKNTSGSKVASNASGTNHHPGGASVVGEEGPELAYTPYGDAQLVGQNGAEIIDLPRGAKVLTAAQTRQMLNGGLNGTMPGYSGGIGGSIKEAASTVVNKAKDTASSALNKASEITDDVISFITDPTSAIKKLIAKNPLSNDIGGIGAGALVKIKDGAVSFLKDKVGDLTSMGSTGSGVERWRSLATTALAIEGQYSAANLQRMLSQMQTESGGNPTSINLWDSNAKKGIPSKGLMQVIDPTYQSYKNPKYDKGVYDPLSNMLASIRYGVSRYGSLTKAYRGVGYKNGGNVNQNGQVLVGEDGPELVDLPFGSHVNNNRKTNELLKQKGNISINFNPTVNIDMSNNSSNQSNVKKMIQEALDEQWQRLISIYGIEVVR